jgi:F0F1-type ATP synthase assembly protein I
MTVKSPPPGGISASYKLVGLGGTFAAAIIGFTLGGWALDEWLGLTPLFTLVGMVVGTVGGFLNVYWKLQAEMQRDKDRQAEKKGSS